MTRGWRLVGRMHYPNRRGARVRVDANKMNDWIVRRHIRSGLAYDLDSDIWARLCVLGRLQERGDVMSCELDIFCGPSRWLRIWRLSNSGRAEGSTKGQQQNA